MITNWLFSSLKYGTYSNQYILRIHKIDNTASGFPMPVFVLVATKMKMRMPMPMVR